MKKLYNKKGKVHPSPSPPSIADPLALLPAAILTLTAALCDEDKQVLAYLISCTNNNNNNSGSKFCTTHEPNRSRGEAGGPRPHLHPPLFQCDCFRCYTSFWARWDASPNRQLIHEIIEAYEERLAEKKKKLRSSKVRKAERRKMNKVGDDELIKGSRGNGHMGSGELGQVMMEEVEVGPDVVVVEMDGGDCSGDDEGSEVGMEKGTMRRLVSFIGDRIWGVWNRA